MHFRYSWLLAIHELKKIGLLVVALLSGQLFGQQSYFNVPSSEKTPSGSWFFQEQTNVTSRMVNSNWTLDYGLNHNWELGLNVLQLTNDYARQQLKGLDRTESELRPLVSLNAQKFIALNAHCQLSVAGIAGSDKGINRLQSNIAYWVFSNFRFSSKRLKWTSGVYSGNSGFIGTSENVVLSKFAKKVGFHWGYELMISPETSLIMDHISGNSNMSMSSIGLACKGDNHWIFSGGVLLPNNHLCQPNGFVIEFTRAL
ncbi:MAG: hypothetical protein ACKOXR_01605 [Bacteroidota bacterium]